MMASRQTPLPTSSFVMKPKPSFIPKPRWIDFKQSSPAATSKPTPPAPLKKDPNVMDVDATQKSQGDGRCWKCGQLSHYLHDCMKPAIHTMSFIKMEKFFCDKWEDKRIVEVKEEKKDF